MPQEDTAARTYHDVSVNENDHLAHAFAIMRDTGLLACMEPEAAHIVRSVIVDLVLKVRHLDH